MVRKIRCGLLFLLVIVMSIGLLASCGKEQPKNEDIGKPEVTDKPNTEPTIIRFGTHSIKSEDPTYKDPVTGQSLMEPVKLAAMLKGIDKAKKELNVEAKYIQYSGDPQEVILKSVLSNDPICELARIPSVGTIIGQNVLQPIDDYIDLFKDPEYNWMVAGKVYGHYYLVNADVGFTSQDCLIYNISYLEKVEALKEDGKTVLPATLWKNGDWTWSKFEDYLKKIKAYYANKKSPVHTEVNISSYSTDVIIPALAMIKTTGASVFGEDGIGIASKDTKRAVKYIEDLTAKGLIQPMMKFGAIPRRDAMKDGETVFTDLPGWVQAGAAGGLGERGEAMGIVPYPRPDDVPSDDPRYQQKKTTGGRGLVKGISKEKSELTMRTFKVMYHEFMLGVADTESMADYLTNKDKAKETAARYGIDVTNEEYGDDMVEAFMMNTRQKKDNEFFTLTTWAGQWNTLLRDSILGLNGTSNYETVIEEQKQVFKDQVDSVQSILNSDKIVDNIAPAISLVQKNIAISEGTDPAKIDWAEYISATDNIDGDIDIKNVVLDTANIKFDTAGWYDKGLTVSVKDKEGNEKKAQFGVAIYDANNKKAPLLTVKEKYRNIKKDEDASKINWSKDFVDKATSEEGFDLMANLTADISTLDVTKPGQYDVVLSVVDYAGNKADVKISVTVDK